jgi:aminopeptidase
VSDPRVDKLATILVDHSAQIKPGDRVLIETTTAAAPLVRALYRQILERGGQPHLQLDLPDQDELLLRYASDEQLDYVPTFRKLAYDQFESRMRIAALTNTRALSGIDPARQQRRQKALSPILETQMRRGAEGSFKWVSTLFPTEGQAMEAGMSLSDYEDFVYRACHADQDDPIAFWNSVKEGHLKAIERIEGHHQVILRGPNVDLTLSVKGRKFNNSHGRHNLPDGEIYTGPVEDSANGWVRFSYPAVYAGSIVEGVELTFSNGKVTKASAKDNEAYLLKMLESDAGARYLGEFAIGTNFEIDRFTRNILFDEKIGGTFHLALGSGYPETGSKNKSIIHWDMICDMRKDSEILVDGQLFYQNGAFVF